jgi:hypothetical protein
LLLFYHTATGRQLKEQGFKVVLNEDTGGELFEITVKGR